MFKRLVLVLFLIALLGAVLFYTYTHYWPVVVKAWDWLDHDWSRAAAVITLGLAATGALWKGLVNTVAYVRGEEHDQSKANSNVGSVFHGNVEIGRDHINGDQTNYNNGGKDEQ